MRDISKKVKKNTISKSNTYMVIRLIIICIIVLLGFSAIVIKLIDIQFINGAEYATLAHNQQTKDQVISPNRGTIYDANGEILAQSISVDTISINPGKVKYSNGNTVSDEEIAKGFSEIFDITYEEMLEKLNTTKSVVVIAKKVEQTLVDKLQSWMSEEGITAGINIDEDSKRYYPYETLASNLIGFCGSDNSGKEGLELRWNDVLTGVSGKIVTATDVNGNAISDEDEQYVASENGSNLYLTIDANIQSIVEKYLSQAMVENPTATAGNAIIMNPQNGEILAMASYPYYNLNSPSSYENLGYTEEEWTALESSDRSTILQNLWKNTAVSGTYEPGSTFKLITASVGLEEGIVETDTPGDFNCTGSYVVAKDNGEDVAISCWRVNPHGSQSLREALCNSCNPAFMQLGQRIGAKTLYKYFKAFGLFEPCGSNIAKAYSGQFTSLETIGPVELATTSFGQRFEISPLQLITAVSAICNDGYLVEPKIVKQIENTDSGSIEVVETNTIRQVISKDTADKVKNMMQSVVTDGTGKHAAVTGYSIGGKSGTSEPRKGHEDEGYTASFIAISPIENTQVVCLVVLYGLTEDAYHQGGQTAGPVVSQILSEVLPYLGITSDGVVDTVESNEDEEKLISVPNVKNMTLADAINKLQSIGFKVEYTTNEDINQTLVTEQTPKSGVALQEGSVINLTVSDSEKKMVVVPNIKGMTEKEATNALASQNLNINVEGTTGIVVSQDPTYETEVEEGTVINVVIKEELTDAQ